PFGVLGLSLVGTARPLRRELAEVAGERLDVLPGAYVDLMTAWGPGRLCDVIELPDPTAPAGRFRQLQQRLRVEGAARHLAGASGALSDAELRRGWVLGVDRRGLAGERRAAASGRVRARARLVRGPRAQVPPRRPARLDPQRLLRERGARL